MREIKFRAWDKKTKTMCFVLSAFMNNSGRVYSVKCHNGGEYGERDVDFLVTDFELMQYTGLKDKNGKEIYEGDIIKKIGDIKTYSIVFDGVLAAYLMDDGTGGYWLNQMLLRDFEIIGNIYENSELLNKV